MLVCPTQSTRKTKGRTVYPVGFHVSPTVLFKQLFRGGGRGGRLRAFILETGCTMGKSEDEQDCRAKVSAG